VLAVFTHGPGIVFNTKRPITKADDLTGLKFRVGGGMVNEISQGAGHERHAQAGAGKLRAAVHRRDGRHAVPGRIGGVFKIDKVIKHATTFPGGLYNTSFVFMMNQAKYDKPAADVKKAIDEMSGEFAARMFGRGWDKVDRAAWPSCRPTACSSPRPMPAFVKPTVKARPPRWKTSGPPPPKAKGLKNAKKVLADFRAEIKPSCRSKRRLGLEAVKSLLIPRKSSRNRVRRAGRAGAVRHHGADPGRRERAQAAVHVDHRLAGADRAADGGGDLRRLPLVSLQAASTWCSIRSTRCCRPGCAAAAALVTCCAPPPAGRGLADVADRPARFRVRATPRRS
jgi:hypothetical protein